MEQAKALAQTPSSIYGDDFCKKFSWDNEKITNLLSCLSAYKRNCALKGIGFEVDRHEQYRTVRREMAEIYSDEPTAFGPISPKLELDESKDEKERPSLRFCKVSRDENLIQRGHNRIQEKVKKMRQEFQKEPTVAMRSGYAKLIFEHHKSFLELWGDANAEEQSVDKAESSEAVNFTSTPRPASSNGTPKEPRKKTTHRTLSSKKRSAPSSAYHDSGNKRQHIEVPPLSFTQMDESLLDTARETTVTTNNASRDALAEALTKSAEMLCESMNELAESITDMGENISQSIGLVAQAIATRQTPPACLHSHTNATTPCCLIAGANRGATENPEQ